MVKKTVLAIVGVVLLVAVFAHAANQWGYTRYGALYYSDSPYYSYYPVYHDYPIESMYPPYGSYGSWYPYLYDGWYPASPEMNYPFSPTSSERYYQPDTAEYPGMYIPRSEEFGLCGALNGRQYGCTWGLVCDYTKTGQVGVGVCSKVTNPTTYPYQLSYPSTNYPYYG